MLINHSAFVGLAPNKRTGLCWAGDPLEVMSEGVALRELIRVDRLAKMGGSAAGGVG